VASVRREYVRATVLYEESLALKRQLGDRPGIALLLNNLGTATYAQGAFDRASGLYRESLALARQASDTQTIALAQHGLGNVAYAQGKYCRARTLYEACLALRRDLGERRGIAAELHSLGNVAIELGDHAEAAARHVESLDVYRTLGDQEGMVNCLEGLAYVAYARSDAAAIHRYIAGLLAAVAAQRKVIGAPLPPSEQSRYDATVRAVRRTLGDKAFPAAWAEGQAMTLDQALTCALNGLGSLPPPASQTS
jgi:tetratricopeptide (TPR) repeat protein